MRNYVLSNKYVDYVKSGSSFGEQYKYYRNGYWYKVNKNGREGLK